MAVSAIQLPILTASAEAVPAAATATGLSSLEAVPAVHRTVAPRLEWNSGLLPAAGADNACALGCAALVSAAATGLLVLLGLAAWLAALGRRITTLAEELLIFSRKREGLPAIAAHELLIFSHISLSSVLQVMLRSNYIKPCQLALAIRNDCRPSTLWQHEMRPLRGDSVDRCGVPRAPGVAKQPKIPGLAGDDSRIHGFGARDRTPEPRPHDFVLVPPVS